MKTIKTNMHTLKTVSSPDALVKMGNCGHTKGTRLPKGGSPKGARKASGKKGY